MRNRCEQIGLSRRDFLRDAIGVAGATSLFSVRSYAALGRGVPAGRKVVIVTFGGGARDNETFSEQGQQYIPNLLNTLAPRSSFFTQVINRGILGHYVATASIATGTWQTFDNFVAQPPSRPTLFEYFRKELRRPREDAWVIAPGNLFGQMGWSRDRRFGPGAAPELVVPKQILAAALGNAQDDLYPDLLRDNYEMAGAGPSDAPDRAQAIAMADRLRIDLGTLRAEAPSFAGPDELAVLVMRQVMRQFAPSLLFVTLHDIDVAHAGAYSLYVDAIRRTDRLCAEIWQETESNPEYKGRTTLLILPDFGRDGDADPGGNGFQHHRTGSASARTTWMMALGPGVRSGTIVHHPIESIDLVPAVGRLLGFDTAASEGKPIPELS